jgi:hypothetical protein
MPILTTNYISLGAKQTLGAVWNTHSAGDHPPLCDAPHGYLQLPVGQRMAWACVRVIPVLSANTAGMSSCGAPTPSSSQPTIAAECRPSYAATLGISKLGRFKQIVPEQPTAVETTIA